MRVVPFLIAALLGLAVTQDVGRLVSISLGALLKRGMALAIRSLHVPRFVAAPLGRDVDRSTLRIVIRTALIALPLLAVFASLLASGDRVFARMLQSILPEWNAPSVLSHAVLTLVGTFLVAVLWRSAQGDGSDEEHIARRPRRELLGFTEWATVLGGMIEGVIAVDERERRHSDWKANKPYPRAVEPYRENSDDGGHGAGRSHDRQKRVGSR